MTRCRTSRSPLAAIRKPRPLRRLAACLGIIALLVSSGCSAHSGNSISTTGADLVSEWIDQLRAAAKTEALHPPKTARLLAYTAVALHEGLHRGSLRLASLEGRLQDLDELPTPPRGRHDWVVAAARAAAVTAELLLDDAGTQTKASIRRLGHRQVRARAAQLDDKVVAASEAYGVELGLAIAGWADDDGYGEVDAPVRPFAAAVGWWIPTPTQFAPPLAPRWGTLRTFTDLSGCALPPPPPFSDMHGSMHRTAMEAVYETSMSLTEEQRDIAEYWSDAPGRTSSPAGHWAGIVADVATERELTLDEAAWVFAATSIAMSDAFVATWASKYEYATERPVTAIRRVIDEDWRPLLRTPPFPDYPSGHSVASGAAAAALTGLVGDVAFVDRSAATGSDRQFESFAAAAAEASISRLYGGIHYQPALDEGLHYGACIGDSVLGALESAR